MCTCIAEEHAGSGCEAVHVRYLKRTHRVLQPEWHYRPAVQGGRPVSRDQHVSSCREAGYWRYRSASHITDSVAIILLWLQAQSNATYTFRLCPRHGYHPSYASGLGLLSRLLPAVRNLALHHVDITSAQDM